MRSTQKRAHGEPQHGRDWLTIGANAGWRRSGNQCPRPTAASGIRLPATNRFCYTYFLNNRQKPVNSYGKTTEAHCRAQHSDAHSAVCPSARQSGFAERRRPEPTMLSS
uniref:Uncharacterized protein n=1 Tax=Candidatus Kentrum sp. FM TaxID=2126340 RepID=A0A450W7S0_9GAMM|nr:MAG: hypothetical protein BECKFM1743C_GA0114222_102771 [Candidatus Kentron sp. FM]VFJ60849.1 MAG: hypothetical protein BECKFM1743A_GA0114220_102731 [Candidatus Kentron sp. FM]VFK13112.1 MAG: hypothetical protein BECKFM1743B_GA0114221_102671 [Candidatus Kentron sp. FM]